MASVSTVAVVGFHHRSAIVAVMDNAIGFRAPDLVALTRLREEVRFAVVLSPQNRQARGAQIGDHFTGSSWIGTCGPLGPVQMEQIEFKERGRVVQQPRRFLDSCPIAEWVIQAAVVPVSCCCAGNPQLWRDLPSEVDL